MRQVSGVLEPGAKRAERLQTAAAGFARGAKSLGEITGRNYMRDLHGGIGCLERYGGWLTDQRGKALATGGRVLANWAVRLLSEWLLSKGLLSASVAEFVSLDSRHASHNFILSRPVQIPNISPGKFRQKYFFGVDPKKVASFFCPKKAKKVRLRPKKVAARQADLVVWL